MKIEGLDRLIKDLKALEAKIDPALDQVIFTGAEFGQVAISELIINSDVKGRSRPPVPWYDPPLKKSYNMLDSLGVFIVPPDGSVLVGWRNAPAYIKAQDQGWGVFGPMSQPPGAIAINLMPYPGGIVKEGFEAANEAIQAALPKELKAIGVGKVFSNLI